MKGMTDQKLQIRGLLKHRQPVFLEDIHGSVVVSL